MGKKHNNKDKTYLTAIEWKNHFGGYKSKSSSGILPLPFNCCSITFKEFKNPVCTSDGYLFDIDNIIPFLEKFKKCPVTGKKMTKNDFFNAKFYKNNKGVYHCPLTYKAFNEHSHIVIIKPSGNVFSYEAVDKLNIKPKNWVDVVSGEKFDKSDIITIQDPHNLKSRSINFFKHVLNKQSLSNEYEETISSKTSMLGIVKNISEKEKNISDIDVKFTGKRLPKNLTSKSSKLRSTEETKRSKLYTTPNTAASFTSTVIAPSYKTEMRLLTEAEKREAMYKTIRTRPDCKAYCRLHTSLGDMNFVLEAKLAPMTCHNFLTLASRGYYDETLFHRLVISFMVQGGDPQGDGFGGDSAFGGMFKDEFSKKLRHDSRGVLSMANSGPNTNRSQFFITFGDCPHLDDKHSVFGKLVGGMETLNRIEVRKTNKETERPLEDIVLKKITTFSDPFETFEKEEKEKNEKLKREKENNKEIGNWYSGNKVYEPSDKVGRYLKTSVEGSSKLF